MSDAHQPFLPRWARYALLPGLLGPAAILGFIFVSETAHDEARCPYVKGETRSLGHDIRVREDSRNCMFDVQDHRYSVIRSNDERVLGRRRLRAQAFAAGHYAWQAELSDQGEVQVVVRNDGQVGIKCKRAGRCLRPARSRFTLPCSRAAAVVRHQHVSGTPSKLAAPFESACAG